MIDLPLLAEKHVTSFASSEQIINSRSDSFSVDKEVWDSTIIHRQLRETSGNMARSDSFSVDKEVWDSTSSVEGNVW